MIAKIKNGVVIAYPVDLRAEFPNTSFPTDLSNAALPEGHVYVWATPMPDTGPFEQAFRDAPVLCDDGKWKDTWSIQPLSEDVVLKTLIDTIQGHLDKKPQERMYDNILSLTTYATSTNPKFAAEGQAGVEWRDACWAKGYAVLAEVQEGLRPIPAPEELIAELPALVWPKL